MGKYETRYIVTDVASIPVVRLASKKEAYRNATEEGWGVVYNHVDSRPDWCKALDTTIRDAKDATPILVCDEDSSATLYPQYGREYVIAPYEDVIPSEFPKRAETNAIIISDSCGFTFWENEKGDIKIFVSYDENGLVDLYRLDNGKPYEGEMEITFEDLQSEKKHDTTDRANIKGTYEYRRKIETLQNAS